MKKFTMPSLFLLLLALNVQCNSSNAEQREVAAAVSYQCIPCGRDCDNDVYDKPGKCPHCQMDLVEKSTVHFKTIEPSMLCQYIHDHPNVVLLDVRTKEEFEGKADPDYGTLKNAINVPVQELEKNISTLTTYKDKEIIVYCSHSHRSPRACYILTQNGFSNVTNMAGGMSVMKDKSCMR
jgi:rhodanese-related sulfurtransferase/DNA-directed RNA polymerase subunit RPC12/RpoP